MPLDLLFGRDCQYGSQSEDIFVGSGGSESAVGGREVMMGGHEGGVVRGTGVCSMGVKVYHCPPTTPALGSLPLPPLRKAHTAPQTNHHKAHRSLICWNKLPLRLQ